MGGKELRLRRSAPVGRSGIDWMSDQWCDSLGTDQGMGEAGATGVVLTKTHVLNLRHCYHRTIN